MGPRSHRLTTSRRGQRGRVSRGLGGSRRRGPWRSDPRLQKLALGTSRNVTSLEGKKPELVHEVEKYSLNAHQGLWNQSSREGLDSHFSRWLPILDTFSAQFFIICGHDVDTEIKNKYLTKKKIRSAHSRGCFHLTFAAA